VAVAGFHQDADRGGVVGIRNSEEPIQLERGQRLSTLSRYTTNSSETGEMVDGHRVMLRASCEPLALIGYWL